MRKCHEVDYRIIGEEMQMVVVELDPAETVIAEAGAMCFMEQDIVFEARMGDGSKPDRGIFGKLWEAGVRKLTGESIFMTRFSNEGEVKRSAGFAAPHPGKIIALDMQNLGGELICQKDAFLCAALGTAVGIAFNKKIGAGLFGGEGFVLQRLSGDGMAFLHAGGTVIEKKLADETLRVDTGCVVGFTPGIDYDIALSGGLKSMIFGGEGVVLTTLSGTGTVWLQSLPFSRLADRVLMMAASFGGKDKGEGSLLGGAGRAVDGD